MLFLFIVTITIAFAFQGSCGLFETTEGRYAEASREMLETNDWLTPHLDNKPHWTKPPMIYWSIAACMKVFGVNTWGARICNSFFFAILVLLIYSLCSMLWGAAAAYLGGIIAATTPFLIIGLNSLSTDILLALWELLTVVSYWKCMKATEIGDRKKWLIVLWISAGFSFLTKGPPGLLSLFCIVIFNYIQKYRKTSYVKIFWFPAIVAFFVSGFTWYVIVVLKNPGLLDYYLTDEIAGRILTEKHHRNPSWYAPLYIYFVPVLLGLGPWLFFWVKTFNKFKKEIFQIIKKKLLSSDEILFFSIWFLVPFIILSFAKSRLILYLLPFFPALIFLTCRLIVSLYPNNIQNVSKSISIFTAVAIIMLKGILPQIPSSKNMQQLYNSIKKEAPFSISNSSIVSLHTDKLFGLQFYFKGKYKRIDNQNIGSIIDQYLQRGQSERSGLVIIDKNLNPQINIISKGNIAFHKVNKKYALYFVK